MLKALGITLIIFVCSYYIYLQISVKKSKLDNLKEIIKAVTYLKHELAFSGCEICDLCEKTATKTCGEISDIFAKVSEYLKSDTTMDFYSAWKKAQGEKAIFSERAEEIVYELFNETGKKSLDIELNNIERTQVFLEETEKEEEQKYYSDRKLICTLGAAFCAAVVIVVI